MCEDPLSAALPVPEPSDIEQAASVQFDDIKKQLQNLQKDLEGEEMLKLLRAKASHCGVAFFEFSNFLTNIINLLDYDFGEF